MVFKHVMKCSSKLAPKCAGLIRLVNVKIAISYVEKYLTKQDFLYTAVTVYL